MSSTWISGYRAAACVDDETGETYFLLSEETCESNVFPRTPRWSARFFGTASSCMASIVTWSSACEGGSLKGGHGRDISPSTYITRWREALSHPVWLDKRQVQVRYGNGFYEVKPELREKASRIMERYGHSHPTGDSLVVDMSMSKALPLLAQLLEEGREEGLFPWRLWSVGSYQGLTVPGLGIQYTRGQKASVRGVRVWRLKSSGADDNFIVQFDGEKAKLVGWEYLVMSNYIARVVADEEVKRPGIAEAQIKAFRKIVDDAPLAAPSVQVVLELSEGQEIPQYRRDEFNALCTKLNKPNTTKLISTVGEIEAAGAMYCLRWMPWNSVTFMLDESFEPTDSGESHQTTLVF